MSENARETETAVERLLLERNGQRKTVGDVFELVLAVNHDSQTRDTNITDLLETHCAESEVRDIEIDELQAWRKETTEHCSERVLAIVKDEHSKRHSRHMEEHHPRAPRRKGDPPEADYTEDSELGDIRRFWRSAKWLVLVAVTPFVVALGDQISHRLIGD